MKIPSFTRRQSNREMQSMTPMIDVVFLLLIFFVCASVGQKPLLYFASESKVVGAGEPQKVELPPPQLLDQINLKLLRQGEKTVVETNGRTIEDWNQLRSILLELAELDAEVPVQLDSADDVPYEDLIAALDLCRECRFEKLNFQLPPPKGKTIRKPKSPQS